jgi:hypothetical protein
MVWDNFDNITSLSTNDIFVKRVENGLIKSVAGEKIRIYLYHYGREPNSWNFQLTYGVDEKWTLTYFQVQYNYYLNFINKATLTFFQQQDSDVEQGIIDVYPKEIKILKSPEFYTEDIMANDIFVSLAVWNQQSQYSVFKEKVPFYITSNEYNSKAIMSAPVDKSASYDPRIEIDVEGAGTFTYYEGITTDNTLKWKVVYTQRVLSANIRIIPIDKTLQRKITRLEIKATVWSQQGEVIKEYKDQESIDTYGVRVKQLSARYLTTETQALNLAKKYLRFAKIPPDILGDEIYTHLNLDLSFLYYGKIYDEIQQKAYLFKIFEYEHYIDLENGTYDTILRGRVVSYEDYYIRMNYWGNQDYWGSNPAKYWGGNYYG